MDLKEKLSRNIMDKINLVIDEAVDGITLRDICEKSNTNILDVQTKINQLEKNIITSKDTLFRNDTASFQLAHQLKLNKLKDKIKECKKIKVVFVVGFFGQFGLETIYELMEKNELFEPEVFIAHPEDLQFETVPEYYDNALETYNWFIENNYKVTFGYDNNKSPIDIACLNPDIIFYTAPYFNDSESSNRPLLWNIRYLTCYVSYGMNTVNLFAAHYDNFIINTCWLFFHSTRSDYYQSVITSIYKGYNSVLSGYPKLDRYIEPIQEKNIPSKFKNDNKLVIYAPHWSVLKDVFVCFSTFDIYFKTFLEMVKENKNINFIFKPHPLLKRELNKFKGKIQHDVMSKFDYYEYIKELESYDNCCYVVGEEYIDIFKKSSCLITDCGSFIAEYLPSQNPCIYLFIYLFI